MSIQMNAAHVSEMISKHELVSKFELQAGKLSDGLHTKPNPEEDDPVPPLPYATHVDGAIFRTLDEVGFNPQPDPPVTLLSETRLTSLDDFDPYPQGDGLVITVARDRELHPIGWLYGELK